MSEPDKNDVGWQGTQPKHSEANSRYDGRYQHIDDQANDDDDDKFNWQNDDIVVPPYQAASTAPRTSSHVYYRLLQFVATAGILAYFTRVTFERKPSITAHRRTPGHHS